MPQEKCSDKVLNECKARLVDFRVMYQKCSKNELRTFLQAQGYDPKEFMKLDEGDRDELWTEIMNNYGLSFDYITPGTFDDQPEGYFDYCLSTGGPGDAFRFFVNPDFSVHRIEYWYLDWFDGANVVLKGQDYGLMKEVYENLKECGVTKGVYDKATQD